MSLKNYYNIVLLFYISGNLGNEIESEEPRRHSSSDKNRNSNANVITNTDNTDESNDVVAITNEIFVS